MKYLRLEALLMWSACYYNDISGTFVTKRCGYSRNQDQGPWKIHDSMRLSARKRYYNEVKGVASLATQLDYKEIPTLKSVLDQHDFRIL